MVYTATITQKGQVTIPIDIRKFLDLKPYHKVSFEKIADKIILKRPTNFLSLKSSIKSKKNIGDRNFDKKVSKFIAKIYAEKNSRS